MADPPLPSAANCLSPLIDVIVDNPTSTIEGYGNPARLQHINYGVGKWSDALAGWKAQATLNLRRVADEMMQARLPLASGQGLRELSASKFFANIVDAPTKAIGQIVVKNVNAAGGWLQTGIRFRRSANPTAVPVPISAADYVSTAPVYVPAGSINQTFKVPVQCVQTGTAGNVVVEHEQAATAGSDIEIVDKLFGTFSVVSATIAGGGSSFSDPEVRAIAGAQPQGRRGPTTGAILAGAYLALGVRHVAVFDDLTNANTVLFVADESWGSDTNYWQPAVIQALLGDGSQDGWAGFGCSLNPSGAGLVDNHFLDLTATVQLRSQQLLQQTSDVQTAIKKKLDDYFTSRPDWYTFRASAIRGVIARADPRILTCTAITITDRFGNAVLDPAAIPYGTAPATLTHYAMQSFTPTFVAPL